ncbi:MAG: hypothetical protein K2I20_00700 [Clostridia bacterium]|nr:hypothetical protein [Clostridia bacterium]MDE6356284.1 hypothetical protein [Clostridia bacterium]MDE7215059.1 hypothetical protein [Clostridia bacterium]
MKISELYGKKVESTAGKIGYVVSCNGAAGKLVCLLCADEDENEFFVDVKNILSVGSKIIFEDRETAIKAAKPIRLGRAGFNEAGKYLGNLTDLDFKGTKIQRAKIGKRNYPAEKLFMGDVIIVPTAKKLKSDVIKDGKVILKKGTEVNSQVLSSAAAEGEFVQTNLKSL